MSEHLTTTRETARTPNLCPIVRQLGAPKGICLGFGTPSHVGVPVPDMLLDEKGPFLRKKCREMLARRGASKITLFDHFGAPNVDPPIGHV